MVQNDAAVVVQEFSGASGGSIKSTCFNGVRDMLANSLHIEVVDRRRRNRHAINSAIGNLGDQLCLLFHCEHDYSMQPPSRLDLPLFARKRTLRAIAGKWSVCEETRRGAGVPMRGLRIGLRPGDQGVQQTMLRAIARTCAQVAKLAFNVCGQSIVACGQILYPQIME
jgi:hypothetical protein